MAADYATANPPCGLRTTGLLSSRSGSSWGDAQHRTRDLEISGSGAWIRDYGDAAFNSFRPIAPEGTTLYIAAFGVLTEVFNPGTSSVKWTDYLSAGSAKVGMRDYGDSAFNQTC